MQMATGYLTGSVYVQDWNDEVRGDRTRNNGFPGEGIMNGSGKDK